ncbi:hypothetical protein J437_LFUL003585 [Ladona fulva]|uniref:Pre-mRNA-processing factor 39 n=1 Tax=Ladona fulva TaxID=123851 RepID=A0A8K0NXC0_LADFU|nr:hypothetical protein J437_LFUL003585 [Ladona fulva]
MKMASLSGDDSDNAAEETVVTRTRSRSGRSTVKSPRRGRKKGPQGRPTRSSGRKLAAQVEVEDEEQIDEYVAAPVEQVAEDNMRTSDQSDIYEPMEVEHRIVEEYVVEEDVAYDDANAGEIAHEENGLVDENGDVEPEAVEEGNVVEEEGYAQMEEEEVESGEEGKVEYEVEEEDDAGDEERVERGGFEEEAVMVALEEEEEARAEEEAGDEQKEREEDEMTREEEVREEEYPEEEEREFVQEEMEDAAASEDGSEGAHIRQQPTAEEEESAIESVAPMEEEENSRKEIEEEEQGGMEEKSEQHSAANDDVSPASPEPEPMLMNPSLYTQDSNSVDDSKDMRPETVASPPKEESMPPVAPMEESQEDGQKKRKRKTRFSLDAEGEVSLDSLAAPAKKVARGDGDSSGVDAAEEKKSPRRPEGAATEEEHSVEAKTTTTEGGEASSDADGTSKKKSKSKKMVSINLNLPSGKDETRPVAVKRLASGVGATAAALLAEAAAAAKATASSEDKKKSGSKSQKRKMLTVDGDTYDPSSPTSENSCDESLGRKGSRDKQEKARRLSSGSAPSNAGTSTASGAASTTTPEKAKKTLPELEKYWKAVKEDPSDFTGWTYLLQYVDQENDVEAAREAYDSFLAYYPYCYGYWRKYADYEKKKGNKQRCQEVFERGLKAIPLSVDLWMHYLNFCKTSAYVDDEDSIRQQFENGVAACGMEFRSDRLWDHYIKWETEGRRFQNVTAIYDRVLRIPTQNHANHFENFVQHIMAHSPQKVLSVDEFLTLRREVLQQLKQNESTSVLSEVHPPAPGADDDDAPPGMEDAPPGDDDDAPPAPPKPSITRSDEETTALREKVIAIRREIHKTTGAMIKRPYFHVKQLERCQLKNWKEYLDFEIEQGDQERIITLFERCLIPCALYEEFWIRFVRHLEAMGEDMVEKVRDVYFRACTIHHTKKPTLHLYWAAFEESQENYAKSAEILMNLEKIMPNLLQVAYRLINLERRRGNLDKVCSLYEHYITTSKNKTVATNMAIKYARFSWKENPRLYLQLISMGLQKDPFDEKEIIAIFDEFLNKDGIETEQKVIFAQRKVDVQKAYDEFQRFTKMAKDRKRKSGDGDKGDGHSKKKTTDSSQQAQQQQSSQSPGQSSAYQQQAGQAAGSYKPADYAASGTTAVSATTASGQYTQPPYPGGQYPPPQQGPPPPYGGQAPYPAGQYNQTTDPNYAGYQNWGYSQTGYGYNQGWGGYNYY